MAGGPRVLLRAANAGCRLRYSPGALVFYRQHRKQMTQDVRGMARGYAVLMERTAQTITREPYHGMMRSFSAVNCVTVRCPWLLVG